MNYRLSGFFYFILLASLLTACEVNTPKNIPTPLPTATVIESTLTISTPISSAMPTSTTAPTATSLPPLSGSGGGVIAFSRSSANSRGEIFAMNADGSDLRQLTHNNFEDITPAWSPDGTQIAFASQQGGNWEIYILDAEASMQGNDRRKPQRLTHTPSDEYYPVWSPDGTQMAFLSNRNDNWGIWMIDVQAAFQNPENSIPQQLVSGLSDHQDSFDWSPDGTQIAFTSKHEGNREIYLLNVQDALLGNTSPQRLTTNEVDDYAPVWSPDGTQIAYYFRLDGIRGIYLLNVQDTLLGNANPQRLTNNEVDAWWPRWSPDGTQIIFSSFHFDGSNHDIYVIDSNGVNQRPLTNDSLDNWWPDWRP